jgi:NitT/TauT family transport system ATP-binding protein
MNLNSEAIKKNDVEIAINNVSVVFKDNQGNDVKALDNIDFDIHKGEFISLLGPSGCGKTTLLRTIADLLEPTSGNVRVSNMTPKEIRLMQKFGIVFQNPVLFEWRTVKKNIELPLEIMGYSKKDRSDRADEMLEMVGLTKFADHYPQQLSGGMQQRVGIARAFGIRPVKKYGIHEGMSILKYTVDFFAAYEYISSYFCFSTELRPASVLVATG